MKTLKKMKLKEFQELKREEMLLVTGGYGGPDEFCKGNFKINPTACSDDTFKKECYDYDITGTCTFVNFYGLKPNECKCVPVK